MRAPLETKSERLTRENAQLRAQLERHYQSAEKQRRRLTVCTCVGMHLAENSAPSLAQALRGAGRPALKWAEAGPAGLVAARAGEYAAREEG